jgi:hypothetical protein
MRKFLGLFLVFCALGLTDKAIADDAPDPTATSASTTVGAAGGNPSWR